MNIFPFVPLVFPGLPMLMGFAIGRLLTMKGWRPIYRHSCGHITDFYLYTEDMCPRCGCNDRSWERLTARDRFPIGYETRETSSKVGPR